MGGYFRGSWVRVGVDIKGLTAAHAASLMRNRKGNGPENPGLLRRMALKLARSEPSKGSMRGKLKKAGWNNDFILDLIRTAKKV